LTIRIADRVKHLEGIGVDAVSQLADEARDPTILRLENLDTDLRPVQAVIDCTKHCADLDECNSYLPFYGSNALREQVVTHVRNLTGHQYDPDRNCVITAGGLNGITATLLALVDPGDLVVTLDPIYIGLLNRVRLAGGRLEFLPLQATRDGWRLDGDQLKTFENKNVKALLMMSPSMPAGAVLNKAEWRAIADFCNRQDVCLIYDAAMERILYDDVPFIHPVMIQDLVERTLIVGSVSKECCMIGWRVGWVLGPSECIESVRRVTISDCVTPVGIAQQAAAAAIAMSPVALAYYVGEWNQAREVMMEELQGLPFVRPHGGWSLLVNVEELGFAAEVAARRLFETGRVASTPMRGWGSPSAGKYLRFVFSNESPKRLQGLRERVAAALNC
jgi:aspartate/methionine/tyrosine aminotransferase